MQFTLSNDPIEIARIPGWIERFARFEQIPAHLSSRINLILEELTTNVITHGFEGRESDRIDVELERKEQSIHFRFSDNGKPYNPLNAPTPDTNADLDKRTPGGLGIHLVREIADKVSYQFVDGWNELNIRLDSFKS